MQWLTNKLNLTQFEINAILLLLMLCIPLIMGHFENEKEYHYIITKVEETSGGRHSSGRLILYNSDGEIWFSGFSIGARQDIKPGDSLYKPKDSVYLYFYRKDSTSGKYVLNLRVRKP